MTLGASYATTAELKTRMSLTVSTYDTQLAEALTAASRGIDKECDRQFNDAGAVSDRIYRPDSLTRVDVDDFSTTTGFVLVTDSDDDGTFETTWTSADYQLEPLNGIVDGETGWPYSTVVAVSTNRFAPERVLRASVRVTAHWGWAAVPGRIKEATLMLAEYLYRQKDAPLGVAGFTEWGPVRMRDNPLVASLIAPYMRNPLLGQRPARAAH